MLDFENEDPLPWDEVPEILPGRNGKKCCKSTIYRWMTIGVAGCRLESVIVAGKRFTTREAVWRFIHESSAQRHAIASAATKAGIKRAKIAKAK